MKLFISYARKDGEDFAKDLYQRLEKELPGAGLWWDRAQMEGGRGWWKQIQQAIDQVDFLVLVMTPGAIASETTRKEWRYARQQGVCVYPVKGVPDAEIDWQSLPRWMFKPHYFNLDKEWQTFVQHLRSPCNVPRVPFMAPDPPEHAVERPREYQALLEKLISSDDQTVAITTALHGAGGFGKTTLAKMLCHDDLVIEAFDDGILWATLGENADEARLMRELTTLYAALTDDRRGFEGVQDAAYHLSRKLEDRHCLIVIDDVWNTADLQPFLQGAKSCRRLITTRLFGIAYEFAPVDVDEMTSDESVVLLTSRLDEAVADLKPFRELARRLGEWPLLLELANASLRKRMARGNSLKKALSYLNQAFDRRGATAFDQRDAAQRDQAVSLTLEVSLEHLDEVQRQRLTALSIFPEDVDVPLSAAHALWSLDEFHSEELLTEFDDLALLKFVLQDSTFRIHDVLRSYLARQLDSPATVHSRLLEAWGDPHSLPDEYAWRWIAIHLDQAKRLDELKRLLLDFHWLKAKLDATDIESLIADYAFMEEQPHEQIQRALTQASHILSWDNDQLATQLLARLPHGRTPETDGLLLAAQKRSAGPWLRPHTASLRQSELLIRTLLGHRDQVSSVTVTPDGRRAISASWDKTLKVWDLARGRLEGTLYHGEIVESVAVTPNGSRAVSASMDGTLKVWELASGREECMMQGHKFRVRSVAVTPDGRRAVSASMDRTLKVWELASGREERTLLGHSMGVWCVAVTPDGRRAVSTSVDGTLKVWELASGREELTLQRRPSFTMTWVVVTPDGRRAVSATDDGTLQVLDLTSGRLERTLQGHSDRVNSVAVTPDGRRAVSASSDRTLKMWDLASGREELSLRAHGSWVNSVAVTPDGRSAVSASFDRTLKVWDLTARQHERTLQDHNDTVTSLAVTPDGRWAVSASSDCTLKVWNMARKRVERTLRGHSDPVNSVAVTPDCIRILSASSDCTLKMWDLASGRKELTLQGHGSWVNSVAVTPDGRRAVSASSDCTLKVWDLASGREDRTLRGHSHHVISVALTPNGRHAVSASGDQTLKVWDLASGREERTLQGHKAVISWVAVTPDGRRAVSTSADWTLRVWDLASGREERILRLKEWGTSVAIAPDGRRILSTADRTLKAWHLASGTALATFSSDSVLRGVAVSPQGGLVVVGDSTGRVHFLQMEGF